MKIYFWQQPESYMQSCELMVSSSTDVFENNYIALGSVDVKAPNKLEGAEFAKASHAVAVGIAQRKVGTCVKNLNEAQETLDKLLAIEAPKDDNWVHKEAGIHDDDIPF